MDHQQRPSGAPSSWLHTSTPSSGPLIPVFLTACHLTTIWADRQEMANIGVDVALPVLSATVVIALAVVALRFGRQERPYAL